MNHILIIKTGRHETFAPFNECADPSLGDVLRTTSLLHLYPEDKIDWLTSLECQEIFKDNERISHLYFDYPQVDFSKYDLIINLELDVSVLSKHNNMIGLIGRNLFKTIDREIYSLEELIHICENSQGKTWQDKLYFLLGKSFKGEGYFLRSSHLEKEFDIGLNWKTGPKWPSKNLEKTHWERVEEELKPAFSLSWQEGFDHLAHYIDWISRCKTLITNDSLGMHIAFALNIPSFIFFGPTKVEEVYFYSYSRPWTFPVPGHYKCLGCFIPRCPLENPCVTFFDLNVFIKDFKDWFNTLAKEGDIGKLI